MLYMRSAGALILVFALSACAGPKTIKQPHAADWDVDFRQTPLGVGEVRKAIALQGPALSACFERERLSSDILASFVFELHIPNDGTPHKVLQLSSSIKGQEILSECLQSVLHKLKFLAHPGPALTLKIPIEPGPISG